jgi:beta-galactosidase
MFHGGTNFGFMNGANHGGKYQPTITSYDYNALLSEAGDMTPAYHAVRKINEEFFGQLPPLTCRNSEKKAYGQVTLTEKAAILDTVEAISTPVTTAEPKYMEQIGQSYGFTLYSTTVKGPITNQLLEYDCVHDRAIVYIDGVKKGWYERGAHEDEIRIDLRTGEEIRMDILVENMGRINYGTELLDRKGILNGVRLGQRFHYGWEMYPMTMDDLSGLAYCKTQPNGTVPAFLRGTLTVEGTPCDTYIKLDGFTKGFVTVNGFNIGRYYNPAGPQKTLYVPAPLLKEGVNEIAVFESDGYEEATVELVDTPILHG